MIISMKTLTRYFAFSAIIIAGVLPMVMFAQTPQPSVGITVEGEFVPVFGENAGRARVTKRSVTVNGVPVTNVDYEFYFKYGEVGQALNQQTTKLTMPGYVSLPWESPNVPIPNLKACTEYQFLICASAPQYPQFSEKCFGKPGATSANPQPQTYRSIGCTAGQSGVVSNPALQEGTASNPVVPDELSKLQNPLRSVNSLPEFIKRLIDVILVIAVPIVAIMIIWSGFLMVTARGNAEQLKKGKRAFVAAIIGGVLVLGSYVIAQAIGTTIDQIRG